MSAEPIKVKKGAIVVKIYPTEHRGYTEYKVVDYSTGKRRLHSFADFKEAKQKADEIAAALNRGEANVLTLRSADRAAYLRALELLEPSGTPLEVASLHYAEAVRILGADRVLEAARYFAKRHPHGLPAKTVGEVADELLADRRNRKKSPRYVEDLRYRLVRFADAFQVQLASVAAPEVRQFLAALKLSARSHNNFVRVIRTLFEFAKSRDYLPRDHDEMKRIDFHDVVTGEIEIFTPDELNRLLRVATPDAVPLLALGAFAGLRSAEIERLDWSEVNLQQRFVKVLAAKAKTASRRIVPIPDCLAAWLSPYKDRTGPVWPHSHAWFYEVQRDTARATKTDHLPALKWKRNALRHSYISYRLAAVQNVNQVALEAGNSATMIFRHYRELVTPDEANTWFSIIPDRPANVVPAITAETHTTAIA